MNPTDLRRDLTQRWAALAPRERALVGAGAAALCILLLWLLALRPIWQTWVSVPAQLQETEGQWLRMQAQAAEAQELKTAAPVPPEQARQALQAATGRLGERATLQWQGERATLTLKQISPAALQTWLQEARQGARARPVEAQLQRQDDGLSGRLVVQLPAGA